ncbi:MAG: universal stress protein [Verrucomicrobiaceae bacterium]|nr:universal stress protein [Verrucomicrobiaceae bacterium]
MQILCATDFSKHAAVAADVAAALARKMSLPLRLVHCAQDFIVMGDLPVVAVSAQPAREELKKEAERLRSTGVEVTEEFRTGSVSLQIVDVAAATPTKMIVIGSAGKGMAERWLIGSVAERVAESAPVPTLVVRQADLLLDWLNSGASLRLLCAVDLTASADAAICALQDFVTLGRGEVEAAYVRPPDDPAASREEVSIRQRDVWERLHAILGDVPVKVHVRDVAGLPGAEFLHTADEQHSGLLVVGTHQRHGWQRLSAPSFSRNVLAHSTTNVLCVPASTARPDISIPKIQRVLLATDFGDPGTATALRHARALLPGGGALHIIHVCLEPSRGINPVIASEVYFDHSIATAKAKEEAAAKMQALPSALLTAPGLTVSTEVLAHHDVAAAICDAAERFGADVICMAAKGRSRTGAALLGSTVQSVLARAHKPVFAITPPLA